MNAQQTFDRLKQLNGSMTNAQRASLAGAFALVVALVTGSAYLANRQEYVLLFSDLDAESANNVVSRLKAAKVDYQLADGGRIVRVPDTRADELRLEFASQGLPSAGRIGFEIFDKVSFGATEFVEQVNFRRALEGELARTIATIAEVSSARVHIAVAKTSLFESREEPAKASVVLKLKSNRPLSASTARGITNLVAAAVDGLRAESVVILDSYGRPLTRPTSEQDELFAGAHSERQLVVEKDLSGKLVALLEPVVGPGRVRVNVAARLNAASEEQTEERWDPNAAVIRSRQTTSDTTPLAGSANGVAGARANMPEAPPANAAPNQLPEVPRPVPADVRLAGRSAETTNYEISHTTRHTIRPQGEVARLSVAVILDDQMTTTTAADGTVTRKFKPRDAAELQKIQNIVSSAVGFDAARGDQLTVENVSFDDRPPAQDPPKPGFFEEQKPQLFEFGRVLGIAISGLLVFFIFIRPMVKKALAIQVPTMPEPIEAMAGSAPALPGPSADEQPVRTIADIEGAIEAELEAAELAASGDRRKIPVLQRRLTTMTQREPEQAARLIRAWIQDDKSRG